VSRSKAWLAASLALSAIALMLGGAALLVAVGGFDRQRAGPSSFGAQVEAYLLQNPEVIVAAVQGLEERQAAKERDDIKTAVVQRRNEIFEDPASPVGGNPRGDVTVVEFFDYNCPYCRRAAPVLADAEKADDGLRIVYKEYPILGPGSTFAARAALASHLQVKYLAFHTALMGHKGQVTESSTLQVAQEVGLDLDRLKQDLNDPTIAKAIERNLQLAQDLRITGTPSFVIGDDVVRGLVDLSTLQKLIAEKRAQASGTKPGG
jgi:protein-disulfide isomerase